MIRKLLVALVLVLVALPLTALAAEASPRVFELKVGNRGFNEDPNLTLTAEAGEMVELHLIYDDMDLPHENPHQIAVEGTNVESTILDPGHPTATLRFRAEKVGTLTLACKISCTGHDRLNARLNIVPFGGAGSAVKPESTSLALITKAPPTPDGKAEARAKVTTDTGAPVEGVTVQFTVRTTFVIADWLPVGEARTNAQGEAMLLFRPNRSGDQTVRARFEGGGRYQGSEKAMNLAAGQVQSTYASVPGLHIPGLGYWLLWTVLGVIWTTFGIVFFNLRQIALNR